MKRIKTKFTKLTFDFSNNIFRISSFILLSLLIISVMPVKGEPIIKYLNDGSLEFSRVLSLENIFNSPVNFKLFNNTGQMINEFYPWLFIYPLYILIVLFNNIIWGYYIYLIILTIITLEITYRCLIKINNNISQSILCSILYVFSTYRLYDIYYRIDLGEIISFTFLPILLLGIYQLFYIKNNKYKYLVIGLTGLVYSRLSSLFVAIVLIFILLVINLIRKNINKDTLISLGKTVVMVVLLGMSYLLPMIIYNYKVNVNFNDYYKIKDSALSLLSLVTNSINNQFFVVNGTGDVEGQPGLGIILFVLIFFVFFYIRKYNKWEIDLTITMGILLLMSTRLFPWFIFQNVLSSINASWRLFMILSLIISYLGSKVIIDKFNNYSFKSIFISLSCLLVVLQLSSLSSLYLSNGTDNYKNNKDLLELYSMGYDGIDYIPNKSTDSNYDFSSHQVNINGNITYITPKVSKNGNNIIYNIDSNQKGFVLLPIYQYKAKEVIKHNNKLLDNKDYKVTKNGFLKVPVSKGDNVYKISYKYSILNIVSTIISISTLLISIVLIKVKKGG